MTDRTVYPDTREGGDVRCFYCREPVGGEHKLDCVMFEDCDAVVTLRRNSDGAERVWREPWNHRLNPRGWWEDGNGECDCNRAFYFARAAGDDEPEYRPCGSERFTMTNFELVMR